MGLALEAILGFKSALAGGGFESLAAGSDDSFQIRSFADASSAYIEEVWACDDASPFLLSIKSPRMHDQVRGLLLGGSNQDLTPAPLFNPQTLLPGGLTQRVYSTDTLAVQVSATAADVFAALFLARYQDLGGIQARLFNWADIYPLIANYVGILTQPIANATKGQWGPSVALNAVDDRLKADTDYALLGWTSSIPVTAVSVLGTDTGNLRVGGPGYWDQERGGDLFVKLSQRHGQPHIPVINSNNAGNTHIAIADVAASTAPNVTLVLAQLSQKLIRG